MVNSAKLKWKNAFLAKNVPEGRKNGNDYHFFCIPSSMSAIQLFEGCLLVHLTIDIPLLHNIAWMCLCILFIIETLFYLFAIRISYSLPPTSLSLTGMSLFLPWNISIICLVVVYTLVHTRVYVAVAESF